ncbi:MAG: hypothetical protein QOK04_2922 [Solirubrobacteraceae bacterium]|jgi:hypothetical protein|nr:hypothetical protein [Solirubrobacteraceae bacterium]
MNVLRKTVLATLALGAIAVGAAGIAGAASSGSSSTGSGTTAQAPPGAPRGTPPQRPGETLLTDGTADKVKAAALAKVPGASVIRVETDADGSPYEAHLRKSDGGQVTVKVDKQFAATAVQQGFGAGGPGGPGAPR